MYQVACRHMCPPLREQARHEDSTRKVDWLKEFAELYLRDRLARCPQCPRTFTGNVNDQSTNLSRHLRTTCKVTKSDPSYKKFECEVSGCGKSFTRCDNFNEHRYNGHKRQR